MAEGRVAKLLSALQDECPTGCIQVENAAGVETFIASSLSTASAGGVAAHLLLLIDFDLTISTAAASECHHMLRDASALPPAFRDDVSKECPFDAQSHMKPS